MTSCMLIRDSLDRRTGTVSPSPGADMSQLKDACRMATTETLIGATAGSGLSKTITNVHPDQPAFTADGVISPVVGQRVLVKNMGAEVFKLEGVVSSNANPGVSNNYSFSDTGDFGRYWEFSSPSSDKYYVWYNVDGLLADPVGATTSPPSNLIGIEVGISAGDTFVSILSATVAALSPVYLKNSPILSDPSSIVFWPVQIGPTTDAKNGNGAGSMPAGASIFVLQEGDGLSSIGSIHNGIYVISLIGGGSDWVLTRSEDFNENSEVKSATPVFVSEGVKNKSSGFLVETFDPISVDVNEIKWFKFTGQSITGGGASPGFHDATASIDGITSLFTMPQDYLPGSVEAWLDGQRYRKIQLVESLPDEVTVPLTFGTPPQGGQVLEFRFTPL